MIRYRGRVRSIEDVTMYVCIYVGREDKTIEGLRIEDGGNGADDGSLLGSPT